jgi:flagellar hook-associated protein 2
MSSISNNLSSGSGLDVQATVDQLIYAERAPERLMQQRQSALAEQATAMNDIQSKFADFEEAVYQLKDFTGALNGLTATSSASATVGAAADSSAATGIHTITVQKLATASSYYTNSVSDTQFTFGTGAGMTVQVGAGTATQLTLAGTTLQEASDYINGLNLGVRANVVQDATGQRLALVSTATGLSAAITITNDSTNLGWQTSNPGQNAELIVDGVPVQSATNEIAGVIPGVTLTLSGETTTPVQVVIGTDTAKAKQAVSDFVDKYNSLVNAINGQFTVNPATNAAGVLASDSTLRGLQSSLLSAMSYAVKGNAGAETLRSIGLEMQNDGTLKLNDTTLDAVLKNNYSSFQNFFQSTAPDGFACNLDTKLAQINDSVDGPIALDLQGIKAEQDTISDQIDSFEVRIQNRQQQLLDEYSRIDTLLRQMPVLQSQITAQLGSLNSQ